MTTATTTTPGSSKPNHLEPSELGTKEYWDTLYTTELTNHASDPSDRGTVWFDDSDAEAKLLEFLDEQATEPCYDQRRQPPLDRAATSLLDLGCGNGSLLAALRADGWSARALGVDYSEKSVALARQIHSSSSSSSSSSPPPLPTTTTTTTTNLLSSGEEEQGRGGGGEEGEENNPAATDEQQQRGGGNGDDAIEFAAWDLLASPYDAVLSGAQARGWDVVLDKGTFDAISLSDARDGTGRRACEAYKGRVLPLVREGGLFLVTSCNWTEEELEAWFGAGSPEVDGGGRFVRVGRVRYPSFSFGGVKGQTISTLCFQRT